RAASVDPTRIPIQFDPRAKRMSGIARHGRTPFDVPFISHIIGNLWQGGCENGLVLPEEIENIVSLYPWEQYVIQHEVRSALSVVMYDDHAVSHHEVNSVANWTAERMSLGPTLVHCQAGLNRSSLVAARVLMLTEGMTG